MFQELFKLMISRKLWSRQLFTSLGFRTNGLYCNIKLLSRGPWPHRSPEQQCCLQASQHHPSYPFSCSFKLVCFLFSFTKRTKKKPLKITTKLRNCRGIFPHIHIHTHEYNLCLVHTPENLKIPISNAMYKYHCLFCFDHIILFVCKIGFVVTLFRPHAVITSINLIHPYIL